MALPEHLHGYIKTHLDMLPVGTIMGPVEVDGRAGALLRAIAVLAELRLSILNEKIKAMSLHAVMEGKVYTSTMDTTKVTEKRIMVSSNSDIVGLQERIEIAEGEIRYLSSIIDIFTNGHLQLRQINNRQGSF